MIRLWNRVGWYRVLAVALLMGAVAGGAAVAADRPNHQPAAATAGAADTQREDEKQLAEVEAERANAERAARRDAQRKADEAAVAAVEQGKSIAKPPTTPGTSKPSAPKPPNVPIPTSCAVYKNSPNRAIGCAILLQSGFGLDQMGCLDKLWSKESGWNHNALNRSSGALGIPQAVPGSKMASAGADYRINPETQIKWGLGYIKGRYGSPCNAWGHSVRTGWY